MVITHHAPLTRDTSKPTDENSPWSPALGTDLLGKNPGSCLDDVHWWIFGHTRYFTEFSKATVKLVSNQRGYRIPGGEEKKYQSHGFLLSIPKAVQLDAAFNVNKTIQV